jgi:transcriptional regulator with PAS, ATPase and Fis domain
MGTIFLDEIGDVSLACQAKLLRVLQEGEIYPVGAERPRRVSARVIAATHRPLEQLVREGRMREDLYFRLRVLEIVIPPLRDRPGDIRVLAEKLLARAAHALHKPGAFIPDEAMRLLESYDWPGNVRELENALTRALVLSRTPALSREHFALDGALLTSAKPGPGDADDVALSSIVRAHAERVLASADGNKTHAARLLRISRQRLDRILNRDDEVMNGADRTDERNGMHQ